MNENEFTTLMDKYCFRKSGSILLIKDCLDFSIEMESKTHGHVYLWVEISPNNVHTIVYVGMAGKTFRNRCYQHKDGFKKSTSGMAHSKRLRDGFREQMKYSLYVRKSTVCSYLDETDIPMQCIEEIAFIKKFSPLWNGIRKSA